MNWKLLNNSEISYDFACDIYYIYEKVYKPKGINKKCENWIADFYKRYHEQYDKYTFFVTDEKNGPIGYVILTEAEMINTQYWSKILEGAVFNGDKSESRKIFIEMFKLLFEYSDQNYTNFFSEVSERHNSLLSLMIELDFSLMNEMEEAKKIVHSFLRNSDTKIINRSKGLLTNRCTSLFVSYTGRLIKRMVEQPNKVLCHKTERHLEYTT
jgi:hypothetical protein